VKLPRTLSLPHFLKGLPGHAYLVGGSVRDLMLGRQPADYDIAVDQDSQGFANRIATRLGARAILLGHGANAIHRVAAKTVCVDTAVMKGADIYSDLRARDFTINSMACSLEHGDIIDPFDGCSDLNNRIVRMVTHNAFDDDPLRLIRAYRMAAELDFSIEAKTRSAITERCLRIQEPAGERIRNELSRIMATPASHAHITAMADTGMLEALFPELIALRTCRQNQFHTHNAWDHTLSAYGALEAVMSNPGTYLPNSAVGFVQSLDHTHRVLLKLAILLHDIGKPGAAQTDPDGIIHFHGHPGGSALLADGICQRLRLSRKLSDGVVSIVRHHDDPLALFLTLGRDGHISPRAVGRFFRKNAPLGPSLLIHALADELGKGDHRIPSEETPAAFITSLLRRYFEEIRPRLERHALLTGRDLIDHFALAPSPLIGRLLEAVEEANLAGELHNRQQALDLVRELIGKMGTGSGG
jgi:poly(A) polymerase